jgi:DnaJ-class molecular chaperone
MPPPDYYAILGVPRTSTNASIKTAYTTIKTAMAKIPAKAGMNSGNKDLEAAYATLSDATKRKAYDKEVDEWVKAHPPIPSKPNAAAAKPGGRKGRQTRRRRV